MFPFWFDSQVASLPQIFMLVFSGIMALNHFLLGNH